MLQRLILFINVLRALKGIDFRRMRSSVFRDNMGEKNPTLKRIEAYDAIIKKMDPRQMSAFFAAEYEQENDRLAFFSEILAMNGECLKHAPMDIQSDHDIVLTAVKQCGEALAYASDGLKNDRGFVLAAVKLNGNALESASDDLKNDHEVVLAAVT